MPQPLLSRLALITAGLLVSLAAPQLPAAAATTALPTGPDVSVWQHPYGAAIDWTRVRAAGNAFTIIKATDGAYGGNPYYASDKRQATAASLVVGAYDYPHPALPISTAVTQAHHFSAVLGNIRTRGMLPPILDVEETGGLGAGDLVLWTQTFLETLRSDTGRTPMIYSYPYFWSTATGGSTAFGRYPLWLAAYRSTPPAPLPGWPSWTLWQSTDRAVVPGISGGVDRSSFNGTLSQLATLADGTATSSWTVLAPARPTYVRATSGLRSATVRWVPGDDGGQLPSHYTVTASPGGKTVTAPGSTSSVVVPGLTPGVGYTFSVTAANTVGTSAHTVSGTVVPGQIPLAPAFLTRVASAGAVALDWPAAVGAPTSYRIFRCTSAPCVPGTTRLASVSAATSAYVDRSVVNGRTYSYAVTAVNGWGSSPRTARVSAAPVGPPSAPATMSAARSGTAAVLTWSAPLSTGGAAVTSYVVRVDGVTRAVLPATARSWRSGAVSLTATHGFTVAATNRLGTGTAAFRRVAAVLAGPTVTTTPTVTALLSSSSTLVGHPVVLSGATSASLAGQVILRQGYYSGAWHTWASTLVSATGGYRFVITPTVRATNSYRLVLVATATHASVVSRTVTLVVR